MSSYTRRRFLEDSLLAAAAMAVLPGGKLSGAEEKQSASPNEKLSAAVIGVNSRGNDHLREYAKRKDVEVTYVVDADEAVGQKRAEQAGEIQGSKPKFVQDLRRVFDDKSVDIVCTATPNHWHALVAIWAMQAGKHVYVEKPASYAVSEGRRMVETARKHNKICQVGMQARSAGATIEAIKYIQSGQIGEVKLARALCYKGRNSIGPKGDYQVPSTVDYNLWSGPAPVMPLTRKRFHYDWHWQWPYGHGDIGNQGVHQMDLARWGLGEKALCKRVLSYGGRFGYQDAGETPNTMVVIYEYPDDHKTLVFEVRGLQTDGLADITVGNIFYGTEGYLLMSTRYSSCTAFDPKGNVVKQFDAGGNHQENFLKAVRSGKMEDLNADVLEGHLSAALCQIGNISYQLGQEITAADLKKRLANFKSNHDPLETFDRTTAHLTDNDVKIDDIKLHVGPELVFDPVSETFPGNEKANKFLTREYHKPFVVPSAGQV